MDIYIQLALSGLFIGGVYALISVGLTLVFGVLRVVNFAHGEYLTIAMYLTYFMFQRGGIDPFVASVAVVPLMFILGLVTERLLIRPTLEAPHVVQVFVTFALSLFLQNLMLSMFTSDFRSIRTSYSTSAFQIGPLYVSWLRVAVFVVALALAGGVAAFLKYTYTGNAIRATAQDRRSARLVGINVDRIYAVTFALGCALVGAAGILLSPLFAVNPYTGADMILISFVIVVLGGMGSIAGAVIAGLLIGMVESFTGYFAGGELKQLVYFVLFMIVLAVRPNGIFGRKGAEVMDVT
ncbi:branched-chain amino acid ABC transporter permease [Bradyrhizobium sp.]|uniref:branched-chain amino acid ABC transporter permease n=1 Tax=Bradyrhizobium sp. TaxID=376 RepID=UPI0039E505B4